jgi:hypothetical protein
MTDKLKPIVEKIFYSPATNGQAEGSINSGVKELEKFIIGLKEKCLLISGDIARAFSTIGDRDCEIDRLRKSALDWQIETTKHLNEIERLKGYINKLREEINL